MSWRTLTVMLGFPSRRELTRFTIVCHPYPQFTSMERSKSTCVVACVGAIVGVHVDPSRLVKVDCAASPSCLCST